MRNASRRSYTSAQKRYLNVCITYSIVPFPMNEISLCSFATFLAEQGLKSQSIRGYLFGVHSLQIENGYPDPQIGTNQPHLESMMRGIKCSQAEAGCNPRPRFPITPDIMSIIRRFLPPSRDGSMVWAACCLRFFGFLRAGKFTVSSLEAYDPASLADIALDSHIAPAILRVHIAVSKTDPFRKGIDIFLGRTSSPVCPIKAYLTVRGPAPGLHFPGWFSAVPSSPRSSC